MGEGEEAEVIRQNPYPKDKAKERGQEFQIGSR